MSPTQARPAGYFARLADAAYVRLTTYRRDGTPVGTAVHLVTTAGADEAFFRTWNTTGKAKRLRHTPAVDVARSSFRGRPLGEPIPARAFLLDGAESARAAQMLARAHPILHGRLIPWYHHMRGWTTLHYRLEPPAGPSAP